MGTSTGWSGIVFAAFTAYASRLREPRLNGHEGPEDERGNGFGDSISRFKSQGG